MVEYDDDRLRDIKFTERQRRILNLLFISKSKQDIAAELKLSMLELERELKKMRKLLRNTENEH